MKLLRVYLPPNPWETTGLGLELEASDSLAKTFIIHSLPEISFSPQMLSICNCSRVNLSLEPTVISVVFECQKHYHIKVFYLDT